VLSAEDNETISRVGPGTPMGSLLREYWLPALLSSELPVPDCDPVRVLLLGEKRSGQSFTGLEGVPLQDRAMTESMDEAVDRTKEHLGAADLMVARVRRRILGAIADHRRTGEAPPGVEHPELYRQRSGGTVLPAEADWLEATRGLREGSEQPNLDPRLSAGV
jgi:hypothetical protein